MVSPEYRAATGPLAVVTLAEDEKDRYLFKIFGYKKTTTLQGLVSPTRSRSDRSSAVPWSGMGLDLRF